MTTSARLALPFFLVALGGCQNSFEDLSVAAWHVAGSSEPPAWDLRGGFIVTTLAPGDGPTVEAGDLVQARVVLKNPGEADAIVRPIATVWVWTGQEPAEGPRTGAFFGSPPLRKALIGRTVHERFIIQREPGSQGVTRIPRRGIMDPFNVRRLSNDWFVYDGLWVRSLPRPAVDLDAARGNVSAELEVLNTCKAKLLKRTGYMRQYGWIFNTFDMHYRSSRSGTLFWFALEGICSGSEGSVRFQAGPYYKPESSEPMLYAWTTSYMRLRPPKYRPDEWQLSATRPARLRGDQEVD